MASITILKGRKFSVSVHDANKRLDFVKVSVTSAEGRASYHHITPDEAEVFAFALRRAAKKKSKI